MKEEKVLVEARYQVVTFRGYQYCNNVTGAIKTAKEMVLGIVNDKWDNSFWWARIIDVHVGTSKIIYTLSNGRFCSTNWVTLR